MDKFILQDFLEKMNENNRFHNDEFRKLKFGFKDKKYKWKDCKRRLKKR